MFDDRMPFLTPTFLIAFYDNSHRDRSGPKFISSPDPAGARLNYYIKYNIALIPFFNEKQDLPSFPEFVDKIKSCKRCEIVLHGLYHENKNGHFDDFHNVTKAAAEEEIRAGLEIFQEIGIKTNVFIPPAWKLNDGSIKVLEKLGFGLAEEQEEYLLLSHKPTT